VSRRKPHKNDPAGRTWIDHFPPAFRTRRGFAALLGGVGFIGFTTYHLATGDGPVSILGGLASGVTVFVLCWYVFGAMTGFGP